MATFTYGPNGERDHKPTVEPDPLRQMADAVVVLSVESARQWRAITALYCLIVLEGLILLLIFFLLVL